jgi:DNA-binding response OmpR family regulator
LDNRLAVLRQGGKFLLEQSVTPAQMVAHMVESLHQPSIDAKILIVDDDQTWLNTLPKLLEPWKFKVTTLADPQQFWTVLKSVCPDVLVLDIKMPQIDGFELCQVLRNDPHWQQLPVLFVSALDASKTQNQAFTVGADDYLCKPVLAAQLANRILNRLQRMRAVCCTHFAQSISQG